MTRRRSRWSVLAALFALAICPALTMAHAGHHPGQPEKSLGPHNWHELWRAWAWEPVSWAGLIVSAVLYTAGLWKLWRTAGRGHGVRRWEAACFAGGWLTLFVALVSPLHPWGSVLFSVHMTQHELLMLVAAPLLVLGRPMLPMLHALPRSWAHTLGTLSNGHAWRVA